MVSRRRFLIGSIGLFLTACATKKTSSSSSAKQKRTTGDIAVVQALASIEALAISVLAKSDASFKKTKAQHETRLRQLNDWLKTHNKEEISKPLPDSLERVEESLKEKAKNSNERVGILEESVAASYLRVIPSIESKEVLQLSGENQISSLKILSEMLLREKRNPVPAAVTSSEPAIT